MISNDSRGYAYPLWASGSGRQDDGFHFWEIVNLRSPRVWHVGGKGPWMHSFDVAEWDRRFPRPTTKPKDNKQRELFT